MVTFKKENAFASETVDSFGGIDRSGLIGKLAQASDIRNFRVLPDGSLEKRDGYELRHTFAFPVDGVAAMPGSEDNIYVLTAGNVYRMRMSDGETVLIGSMSDMPGGCLFTLGGEVYVQSGGNIRAIGKNGLERVEGYIPLYGRDWTENGGRIYQPRNLLSTKIRVRYQLEEPASALYVGFSGFTVEKLLIDGEVYEASATDGQTVGLPEVFPAHTRVEVCLDLNQDSASKRQMLACDEAVTVGIGSRTRTVLCSGDTLYISTPISQDELAASRSYSSFSREVYFPESGVIHTGMGLSTATTGSTGSSGLSDIRPLRICGNGERLIVSDRYRSCLLDDDGTLISIPGSPGAQCSGICIDDDAYIVSHRGLFRFRLSDGEFECLSGQLELAAFGEDDMVMGYDPCHAELLICSASDDNGRVAVYSLSRSCWYGFSGVGAQGWFDWGDTLCFYAENGIFVFVPGRVRDKVLGGTEQNICALYVSRWSGMGVDDMRKRLRALRLCKQGNESLALTLSDPAGTLAQLSFAAGNGTALELHRRTLRTGRFRHVQLTLQSYGTGRQRVFGVAMYAVK